MYLFRWIALFLYLRIFLEGETDVEADVCYVYASRNSARIRPSAEPAALKTVWIQA